MGKSKYFMCAYSGMCSKKLHIAHATKQKHQKMGKISTQT